MERHNLVRPRRTTLARYGAGLVAGLATSALVGCGADETPAPAATSSAPAAPSSAPPTAPAEETASASPSASASAQGDAEAVSAAAATAVREVSGAVVVAIESEEENGTPVWQVQLVTSSNDEQELDISADGSEVVRTERVERQDAEDRRENRALLDALDLEVPEMVEALPASVRGGTIDSLEADLEGSRGEWEAEVRAPDGQRHEIRIDAGSGDVISDRT